MLKHALRNRFCYGINNVPQQATRWSFIQQCLALLFSSVNNIQASLAAQCWRHILQTMHPRTADHAWLLPTMGVDLFVFKLIVTGASGRWRMCQ
jgi:hypothetical protein